jgi:hypothetical protein
MSKFRNLAVRVFSSLRIRLRYYNRRDLDLEIVAFLSFPVWYHNFKSLGFPTAINPDPSYSKAQKQKEQILLPLIEKHVGRFGLNGGELVGAEYFGADAYYSFHCLNLGVSKMYSIDLGQESPESRGEVLGQARVMSRLLDCETSLEIRNMDVFDFTEKVDFILCFGGLYHLEKPIELMQQIFDLTDLVVVQTIVSLQNTSQDYFETPAPNWSWGSRMSEEYFKRAVRDQGWKILEWNLVTADFNSELSDRGNLFCVLGK